MADIVGMYIYVHAVHSILFSRSTLFDIHTCIPCDIHGSLGNKYWVCNSITYIIRNMYMHTRVHVHLHGDKSQLSFIRSFIRACVYLVPIQDT